MIGERGSDGSDSAYVGEQSTSAFSLDYYRSKYREFQTVLSALDEGWQSARAALSVTDDPALIEYLQTWLAEFDSKKFTMKATAEAMNLGAATVNAVGGRMPSLSIPSTLGLPALALPLAAVAAVATAGVLMLWGRDAIKGLNERLKFQMVLDAQDSPEKAAELAAAVAQSDAALAVAESSPLATLAPLLKWGGLALLAFMAYRAIAPSFKGK